MYNVEGLMLPPLVVETAEMSANLRKHYSEKLSFVETPHGKLTFNCFGGCVESIYV